MISRLLDIQGFKYAKSTIDSKILHNHELDSVTESESESLNYDEENVPEYDTEEDER